MREISVQVLVPALVPLSRAHRIELLEALREAAGDHVFGGARDLLRLRNLVRRISLVAHFHFDLLLVFVDDADREAETHDYEVDRRAIRCDRRYPSALA